jgi:hypothetical protein
MFIKNDFSDSRRWVNGTIGIIEFIADDIIEAAAFEARSCSRCQNEI